MAENLSKMLPDKTNVVTGDGCVRCCKAGKLSSQLEIFSLLGDYISALNESNEHVHSTYQSLQIALYAFTAPPTGPVVDFKQFRIKTVPPSGPVGTPPTGIKGGTLILLIAAASTFTNRRALEEFTANATAAIAGLQEALQGVNDATRTAPDIFTCEECCKKRLLSQANPRKKVTETVSKRLS